ncbi:hypothetical protein EYZ11_006215 [Aspergillus tanneri]|uniref:Uncharacterized protein n=1 Tax=Aspergillus tanneri TaxID=1220188 RepID=A0A4S3JG15_9EURO|nr:hypothetical protein EYZ11_006215 [Aspergillus tanneri]
MPQHFAQQQCYITVLTPFEPLRPLVSNIFLHEPQVDSNLQGDEPSLIIRSVHMAGRRNPTVH